MDGGHCRGTEELSNRKFCNLTMHKVSFCLFKILCHWHILPILFIAHLFT